jgi:hypothetical protein
MSLLGFPTLILLMAMASKLMVVQLGLPLGMNGLIACGLTGGTPTSRLCTSNVVCFNNV